LDSFESNKGLGGASLRVSRFRVRGEWFFWWDPPSYCEWGYSLKEGSKNIVLLVERRALGVVGVSGVPN